MPELTLGSLFDGIAGFPESASRHGITPVWASEIDPFCIRVSSKHFPDMKHLGSVMDINGGEIEPVDIITFGSPCQNLSVAGKREGLQGDRSHLFFEAVRIIAEMREATGGKYPRFAIWENVPGAFSSNGGRDFRAVLEALTEAEIPMPSSGRWADAGMVRGNGREVAWRCLDAQYHGVAQRRKRIFLVTDFGGECAAEILLEPVCLPRDPPQGQKAREEAAACAGDGVEGTGRVFYESGPGWISEGFGCLRCEGENRPSRPTHTIVHPLITGTLCASAAGMARPAGMASETDLVVAQCVTTETGRRYDPESETLIPVAFGPGGQHEIAHALRAQASKADKPDSTTYVIQSATMSGDKKQNGLGVSDGPCYTLDCRADHAVAYDPKDLGRRPATFEGVSPTLKARAGTGGNNVPVTQVGYAVRRLTVIECLRLQGFPDAWLDDIPGNSDTAYYKVIGNSLAIPVVEWIFKRLTEVYEEGVMGPWARVGTT